MELYIHLKQREAAGNPIRVGLVGCVQVGLGMAHVMRKMASVEPVALPAGGHSRLLTGSA